MNKLLLTAAVAAFTLSAQAQITITAADMPVNGDTLRWSAASPVLPAAVSIATTGANTSWDFTMLTAVAQGVDNYKFALQVNPAFGIISPTAYGYKVADSIPGLSAQVPISVKDIYTFYSKKPAAAPTKFVAEGFAATIASLPTPAAYSDEDEIYLFPLTYPHVQDSTTFKLSASLFGVGSFSQQGNRKTQVDGWGTIKTPYTTSPVAVIRVRSELTEIDSVTFAGTTIGLPRTSVEYKWLANGQHYPMLYITTTKTGTSETVSSVRYRDTKRALGVPGAMGCNCLGVLQVSPIPATSILNIMVPAFVKDYTIQLWNMNGQLVRQGSNISTLDIADLASGQYVLRAQSGNWLGFAKVVR